MFLKIAQFFNAIRYKFSPCPRVKRGYKCHKDSKAYNYKCEACGRIGDGYDPDIIDR